MAGLVRSVYHESVHVRLMFGKEKGYNKIVPLQNTDNPAKHEVIASYLQLSAKGLPTPMRPNEIKTMCNYGIDNYKLIVNQGQKQRYEIYYNYFQTLMQKYK